MTITSTTATPHTDIKETGWIAALPEKVRPYALLMRLDRPIGTWLLLLPSWWAILAASHGVTNFSFRTLLILALFGIGALVMRGAGCVINDLWDRDFDPLVERTKNRPLAAKTVTPKQAVLFTGFLFLIGFLILVSFNMTTILFGIASLVPVILYPLAKRVTWYPQAVLGLTFNFGALMGAAAILDTVPPFAWTLYAAGFFWTLGYDTIYARQDMTDDALIGVKSTALRFGENVKTYVAVFYTLLVFLLLASGYLANVTTVFYSMMGFAVLHLLWQVRTWDIHSPSDSLEKFRSNRDFAWIVAFAFLCGFFAI